MPTTPLDKVRAWAIRFGKRFVVVDCTIDWGKLTTFKTYRNASRNADDKGVVLMFDPTLLPIVLADAELDDVRIDNLTELEFCERQIEMWSKRALLAEQGSDPEADANQKRTYRAHCTKCGHQRIVDSKAKQFAINSKLQPCAECVDGKTKPIKLFCNRLLRSDGHGEIYCTQVRGHKGSCS